LAHKKIKLYLEELERLRERFRETDEELTEFKDFANTEYYKRKVPAETLDKYVDIKEHLSGRLEELEPQGTPSSNSTDAKVSNRDLATIELPKISLMTSELLRYSLRNE